MTRPSTIVLVDFDGTATPRDSDFALADAWLGPAGTAMYGPLAEAYERLEIGMLDYFTGYLDGLNATPEEIARVASGLPVRPGLPAFAIWCDTEGLELRLLSEGLDVYIQPILAAAGLGHLPLSCNRAEFDGDRYRILPAPGAEPCDRCLNCKGARARRLRAEGATRVVIIGNGASDLCAAREADLVLARDTLQEHCEHLGIAHHSWQTFDDVQRVLAAWR